MQQLIQFIVNHWVLVGLLAVVLALLIVEEQKTQRSPTRLSSQDATHLINRERALVIDIRDVAAFNSGHIIGAMHLPQATIMDNLQKIKKYREKPVILVDNAGQHSALISQKLRKENFTRAYALAGGIQGWKNDGLPLTKT